MPLKITKADDPILTENLIVVICGEPGTGKTSLAFSNSKPLLIDTDLGAQRAVGRKDIVQVKTWKDIEGLTENDLKDYNTIIIDTVGRLLEILAQYLIMQNPKLGRGTGELTLQGYGGLNQAFKSWISKLKSFKKDIIIIGHSKEDKKGDDFLVRIDAMGSSKNELYKIADLLGYMCVKNQSRTLNFNPTDTHLGKNCANIPEQIIPHINDNEDFMAQLLANAKNTMNQQSIEQIEIKKKIRDKMDIIDCACEVEHFNSLLKDELIMKYIILKKHLHTKATEQGLEFDKENKIYKVKIDYDE